MRYTNVNITNANAIPFRFEAQLKRCPYCHEHIDESEFVAHCAAHEKIRPDGQHEEYITLPPELRLNEMPIDEPQVYQHRKCGECTQMPEEIIRSYLVNPYLYLADRTFCTGCGVHVPARECVWTETGEDLQSHTDRLRAAKPECRPGFLMRIAVLLLHQKWIR